jgi:hypothetical protein
MLGVQLTANGAVLGGVYTALDSLVVYNMSELAIDDGQKDGRNCALCLISSDKQLAG